MLDLRYWPKAWSVQGRSYDLRYLELSPGGEQTDGLKDAVQLHPRFTHVVYYAPVENDHFGARMGPARAWRPDGSLAWQSHKTDLLDEDWRYDAKGRLAVYHRLSAKPFRRSWLSCERQPRFHILKEWYSEDGQLVAFEGENEAYWRGVRLPLRAYSDSLHHWSEMRYPMRGAFRD
jgi:hypothetical protein